MNKEEKRYVKIHYGRPVDMLDKRAMYGFLKSHFRYDTMRSWNRSRSYANNVKVHNLDLPDAILHDDGKSDLMYDILSGEAYCPDYEIGVREIIAGFEKDHPGYTMGFNGRSSGYLVLYDSEHPGKPIDVPDEDEIEEMSVDELGRAVQLVRDFDKACDEIRALFIDTVLEYRLVEQQRTVTVTEKFVIRDK